MTVAAAEAPDRRLRSYVVSIVGPAGAGTVAHTTLAAGQHHDHILRRVASVAEAVRLTHEAHPGGRVLGTREVS